MRFAEFKITETATNPDVAQAQSLLKDLGYNLGPTGVDGIVGPYTQSAIDQFQDDLAAGKLDLNPSGGIGIKPNGRGAGIDPDAGGTGIKVKDVPAGLPVKGKVSSPFGYRSSVGKGHSHNGTDFAVPVGTPIVAPASGVIKSAGNNGGGEGIFVILDAGGVVHKFFHLSKILAQSGQQVKKGETIGLSGNTGYSTGPHLHWEKHVSGRPVDPMSNIG